MERNNSGLQELARVLDDRMKALSIPDTVLDFGKITKSYELVTTEYPVPIPRDGYQVCRHLTLGDTGISAKMRKLKPGDRVLVAWVRNEPVVIDITIRADNM